MFTHKWLPLALLGCSMAGQQPAVPVAKADLSRPVTIKVRFINYKNGKPLKGLQPLFFEPQLSYVERDKLSKSDKSGLVEVPIPEPGTPDFLLAGAPPWHQCGGIPIPTPWGLDRTRPPNELSKIPIERILTVGVTMDIDPAGCHLTQAQAQALYEKYPPQPGIITYFMFKWTEPWF